MIPGTRHPDATPEQAAVNYVRPAFVARMQAEILANWYKQAAGWLGWVPDVFAAVNEIRVHITKLAIALRIQDRARVSEHCADIAIVCMKCAELYGED